MTWSRVGGAGRQGHAVGSRALVWCFRTSRGTGPVVGPERSSARPDGCAGEGPDGLDGSLGRCCMSTLTRTLGRRGHDHLHTGPLPLTATQPPLLSSDFIPFSSRKMSVLRDMAAEVQGARLWAGRDASVAVAPVCTDSSTAPLQIEIRE